MKVLHVLFCCLFTVSVYAQTQNEPLNLLKEGNKRFTSETMKHQNQSKADVQNLKTGQHPFATIISCSDSRVSPEIVFDQGLGDLFCIRTAGNVMSDYEEGSIEYAAEHLHTKLIVVMGHKGCGAVKAFIDYTENKANVRNSGEKGVAQQKTEVVDHIQHIMKKMESEQEQAAVFASEDTDNDHHYEKAVVANVINGVKQLRNSEPILSELFKSNEIQIVGAIYDINTGEVVFLDI